MRSTAILVAFSVLAFGARAQTVVVTRSDCALLTRHVPAADVAFKPGVDVHGRPVAPADLPGGATVAVPNEIGIDITLPLRKFAETAGRYRWEAGTTTLARITYDIGANRLMLDGQPLGDPVAHAIAELCAGRQGQGARR
ncbi:MAG: hypothetical protein FJX46_04110 [Alphaproteobacteria bacterium]|nr:hypothetical protein [Alphaproteobacteria bacterium]